MNLSVRCLPYPSVFLILSLACLPASAAINWDAEAGTSWWFNPINWNETSNANTTLPGSAGTDTQINIGYNVNGAGVVFDPTNDPHFPPTISYNSPYGPQSINQLYISRASDDANPAAENLLTIRGNLEFRGAVNVGRSSGVDGTFTTGRIVQESGIVSAPFAEFTIAAPDTTRAGLGKGIYEYRGGTFNVDSSVGLRLSHGSTTQNNITGEITGVSGEGRFIVGNPASGGFVRAYQVSVASAPGAAGNPAHRNPDGVTRGVGVFEFRYENGGTRPFQVGANLSINNGLTLATGGTRSSRLELVLNEPVTVNGGGVPINLGLFDVDFDKNDLVVGSITGTGDLNGDNIDNNDRVFSNGDGTVHYREGDMVSAIFSGVKYNWTISYTGDISWIDADNSVVNTILSLGNGRDVVLIGHSSELVGIPGDFDGDGDVDGRDFLFWQRGLSTTGPLDAGDLATWQNAYVNQPLSTFGAVPEPSSILLLCAAGLPLVVRRGR